MVLTNKALGLIDNVETRIALASKLKCTEQWIIKLIAANKNNGPLTTYTALAVIREKTGMRDDQIVTEKSEKVKA